MWEQKVLLQNVEKFILNFENRLVCRSCGTIDKKVLYSFLKFVLNFDR